MVYNQVAPLARKCMEVLIRASELDLRCHDYDLIESLDVRPIFGQEKKSFS